MARWKEIDILLKMCRMSLIDMRLKLEGSRHEESEYEKFEKSCDEVVVKCSKNAGISEDYFRELLLELVQQVDEEEFIKEYEETFKNYLIS